MVFSARLKGLLSAKGVNWQQVSKELSIGKNQQKYWEDKDSAPDGKTLVKLAQYFGVSTDYLLGNDDLMERALNIVNESHDTIERERYSNLSEQEKALLSVFRATTEEGRLLMIQNILNIRDTIEKKNTGENTASVG